MARRWLWLQLATGYGILELALWTSGRNQVLASWSVAVWIMLSVAMQGRSATDLGIARAAFRRGLIALPLAALASFALILLGWMAGTLGPLHGESPVWLHALSYTVWAVFQQFMLQSFFYLTLEKLLESSNKATWITAGLFAAAHIPNPVLVPATFLAGLAFVRLFQRARNIYPLGMAHALLGLSIAISAPHGWIRNMRVGASYFHYHARAQRASAAARYPTDVG